MSFVILIFGLSFLLTYVIKRIAQKKSLLDVPNERSSHTIPTPRGGGLAIAITWFSAIAYLFYEGEIEKELFAALFSGILLCIISFIDDIYTLKALPRFMVHALVAALGLYFIGGVEGISFSFFIIPDSYVLNFIAFVGIIWFINLFNFIDGIDGYAAGETIFVSLAMYFFIRENYLIILAMTTFGFLLWNWDKAKIFMGDVGSTMLGYTLIILMIHYNNNREFSLVNGLILSSVFWFDATYTLYKRFRNKEKLSEAHRKHAYQRITQYGFSHQKTVLSAMLINTVLFSFVIITDKYPDMLFPVFSLTVFFLFSIYKWIDTKKPF